MLYPRIYKPKIDEIIYHYCNPNTFHALCSNKTIRFSDLFSMNDFLEVHWGYSIWEKTITQMRGEISEELVNKVNEIVNASRTQGRLLASCFSLDGDVLSQWRAYSDDGRGYAIGFLATEIYKLPARSLQVQYDELTQINETKIMIKAIAEVEKSEKTRYGEKFVSACLALAFDLAAFKNPAFSEEREVRFTHVITLEESNESHKLIDTPHKNKSYDLKFRMSGSLPVPFIDFDFTNDGKVNPVKEVILGPKNTASESAVSIFLETLNIPNVSVKKSKASYR